MSNVRLVNVRKVYEGGVVGVHTMNLEVKDREFVVLVGPSGCGKTTTLRMVAGLESVTEGDIYIDGRRVNDVAPKDRDVAMVFQNYALYPHMSVYENMAFGLKMRGFPREEIENRVRSAAAILGIEDLLGRKPKALSGGQRQRVAVGRAIVRKPKVFLFDEPLSNLDAKFRVQMRTEIIKLHQRLEATMIYVTHDQTEAITMGDRIVVMKDGYVHQIDTPLNLYNKPANMFVAGFIGSPAMNFFEGVIVKSRTLMLNDERDGIVIPLPIKYAAHLSRYIGRPVTLGIRPEHISYTDGSHSLNTAQLKVHVEVVEPMGNEVFVYFTTSKNSGLFVARMSPTKIPAVQKSAQFTFDLSRSHFFDGATEARI